MNECVVFWKEVQWNSSITDTIGNQHFVLYSELSGLLVDVVLRNPAVEYNVAPFSELSLAVRWQGGLKQRLILQVTVLI